MKNPAYKSRRGGARQGAGRISFEPAEADRSLVKTLSAIGFQHSQIAGILRPGGIDEKTLRKYFRHELAVGKDHIDAICVMGIVKAMQAGNFAALCFYAKTRMGWREQDLNAGAQSGADRLDEVVRLAFYGPARPAPKDPPQQD
jgi:hypothetical protein